MRAAGRGFLDGPRRAVATLTGGSFKTAYGRGAGTFLSEDGPKMSQTLAVLKLNQSIEGRAMVAKRWAVGAAAVVALCCGEAAQAALRVVAYGGQQAPGMPQGTIFDNIGGSFYPPVIDAAGRVAFSGTTRKQDLSLGGNGVWTDKSGAVALLAKQNDPAPGTAATFNTLYGSRIHMTDSGVVTIQTGLSGNGFGYFSDRSGRSPRWRTRGKCCR